MKKPQLMAPAARAQLMATACDALQQALCKVYDLLVRSARPATRLGR